MATVVLAGLYTDVFEEVGYERARQQIDLPMTHVLPTIIYTRNELVIHKGWCFRGGASRRC